MKTFRYSARSFERAVEAGVFGDKKVELIAGVPHVMTTNPPHVFAVQRLASLLRGVFPADAYTVHEEKFVALGGWRPQPDVAVIRLPSDAYLPRLAGPEDIELLAEVSDTSYPLDRGRKLRKYAASGIATYWIVSLGDRIVQVFTDPQGSRYRSSTTYREGESVLGIAVDDVLPPP